MKNPKTVLEMLHGMTPVTAKKTETKWERLAERWSMVIMVVAFVLFVALGVLALWHNWQSRLSETWVTIAMGLAIGAMGLPIVSLICQILSSFYTLYRFKRDSLSRLLREIEHDSQHVEQLINFDLKALEAAQTWLKLKCTRMRSRLSIFTGGSDKIAIFSLAGMGWAVWKELSEDAENGTSTQLLFAGASLHELFMLAAAFLTGIALGAVFMNRLLSFYEYQLELLELALSEKNANRHTPFAKR